MSQFQKQAVNVLGTFRKFHICFPIIIIMQTEHLLKQVSLAEPCPNCLNLRLFVQNAY